MKYNSFYDEQNTDKVIQFNNVHNIGTTIVSEIIGVENNYNREYNANTNSYTDLIKDKDANVINAIDIDWNGANVDLLGTNTVLNTSGQLLGFYKDSINTSYDLANSAYNLADEVKSQLSSLSGLTPEQIQQINNLLNKNVLIELREPISSFYKYVNPNTNGSIKLGCISKESYIPINIEFNNNEHEVDFGVSTQHIIDVARGNLTMHIYDNIGNGLQTNNLSFKINNEESYIPVYSKIENTNLLLGINKSDIPSTNYTGDNTYININDSNVISLNENEILSYLKTTELNKNYTSGIGIDINNNNIISTKFNCTKGIGTNNDPDDNSRNLFIVLADNSYLKFVDNKSALAVDINAVKAYIGNSGQGQTITIDSELNSTSTNPVQNKVINNQITNINSQITNINNQITNINTDLNDKYIQIGGETTGTLAVIDINGKTINASNASTDGTDIYISSDRRLKDNILDITDGEVERLFETESGNMHYFEWKENHKPSFGFIAQELIHFAPETVTQDSEYMQVNYNAALTKTCAALFKKIKQLEERIKILEGES